MAIFKWALRKERRACQTMSLDGWHVQMVRDRQSIAEAAMQTHVVVVGDQLSPGSFERFRGGKGTVQARAADDLDQGFVPAMALRVIGCSRPVLDVLAGQGFAKGCSHAGIRTGEGASMVADDFLGPAYLRSACLHGLDRHFGAHSGLHFAVQAGAEMVIAERDDDRLGAICRSGLCQVDVLLLVRYPFLILPLGKTIATCPRGGGPGGQMMAGPDVPDGRVTGAMPRCLSFCAIRFSCQPGRRPSATTRDWGLVATPHPLGLPGLDVWAAARLSLPPGRDVPGGGWGSRCPGSEWPPTGPRRVP